MIFPPSFVHVERGGLGIWLPVFLLWPFVALGLVLTVIAAAIALLVLQPRSLPLALDVGVAVARVFCATRGTRVEAGPLPSPFIVTVH
ncbi:MAG TPA: hypothetical protein VMB50_10935 [Myxococcales bacterium]|nr:hypothetical protein [Myxococcales bacterium]